jgi:putative toxin-antitoxin system antitoxin component (TIGR02293 family)
MTTKASATAKTAAARTTSRKASVPKAATALGSRVSATNFLRIYNADAMDRVKIIKRGVQPKDLDVIARRMSIPKDRLYKTLGLARATIDRKMRTKKLLSIDEGSRVVGMARLVGQVQAMVEESGRPEGFNAAEWVARWLEQPLPALNGQRPAELMDTAEGQGIVSQLLARMQSGAYA